MRQLCVLPCYRERAVQSLFSREDRSTEVEEMPRWRRILRRVTLSGPDYPSRRIARRVTFFALLGLSAVFGAMCGLMLVYSIDLPQMDDLARYRPNTTTELLDVHGKVFGSFALERRVVVPYTEFPPVLRQAIISIEDKSFERNWGVNLVRAVGAAYRDLHSQRAGAGGVDADDAAGAESVSLVGEDVWAQDSGGLSLDAD